MAWALRLTLHPALSRAVALYPTGTVSCGARSDAPAGHPPHARILVISLPAVKQITCVHAGRALALIPDAGPLVLLGPGLIRDERSNGDRRSTRTPPMAEMREKPLRSLHSRLFSDSIAVSPRRTAVHGPRALLPSSTAAHQPTEVSPSLTTVRPAPPPPNDGIPRSPTRSTRYATDSVRA